MKFVVKPIATAAQVNDRIRKDKKNASARARRAAQKLAAETAAKQAEQAAKPPHVIRAERINELQAGGMSYGAAVTQFDKEEKARINAALLAVAKAEGQPVNA